MKIFGIILTVLGGFNIIALILALDQHPEDIDKIARAFNSAISIIVLGSFLIYRANKKKNINKKNKTSIKL